MTTFDLLQNKRAAIFQIAEQHGAKNIRIFGSVARGDDNPESDVDFLVEMEPGRDFLDVVAFWQDLQESLGRKTDVLTDGGISPYLQKRIYSEARPL